MLPLQASVDLGAMAMKGYSAFPKAPALLEPHHQIVSCHIQDTRLGGVYPSTEVQSVILQPQLTGQYTELNVKVLFQIIQFSISTQIGPLSGATTLGQSRPGSNGNEGVLCIPQSSSIAGTSPSDCLVSYPGHSWGGGLTPLQRSSRCILQPQPTGQWNIRVCGRENSMVQRGINF